MTSHAERMAALVAAGEKVPNETLQCLCVGTAFRRTVCDDDEQALLQEPTVETFRSDDEIRAMLVFAKDAANARQSIALAAEGMKALKEWRECERQMNNVPNDTNDYHNAYNAMGAAWRRLDALLERWEGKE